MGFAVGGWVGASQSMSGLSACLLVYLSALWEIVSLSRVTSLRLYI